MNWGLQHVKVTLEEQDSGETVVIEQSSDGRVKCERGRSGKAERAANSAPRASEAKVEEPVAKPEEPREERRGETKKAEARPSGGSKRRTPKPKPKEGRKTESKRSTSLGWEPIRDHDYDGFAAESGVGAFKALIAKQSIWALFYEVKDIGAKQLGCFKTLDEAKKEAQKRHDKGWPETEFGALSAGRIAKFCPAPEARDEGKEDAMKTTPKTEKPKAQEKQAAPPPAASKTEAEQDRGLMASFASNLESVLDEDEDD